MMPTTASTVLPVLLSRLASQFYTIASKSEFLIPNTELKIFVNKNVELISLLLVEGLVYLFCSSTG